MWSGTVKKRNNPNPNCKTGGMLAQTPLTEALKAQFKILWNTLRLFFLYAKR